MHLQGRAQIGFTFRDGAVRDIALTQTSQSGLLDRAALAAVRDASYPPAPRPLAGTALALLVWVNFDLTAEE